MTKIRIVRGGPSAARVDLVVVPVVEGEAKSALRGLERRLAASLGRRLAAGGFRGRADQALVHQGDVAVVLLGLGPAPLGADAWRRGGARARQEAERQRARRVALYARDESDQAALAAFVEGFTLGGYRFTRYASDTERGARVESLALVGEGLPRPTALQPALAEVEAVVTEVFRARDLVNEPASVKTPRYLGEEVKRMARAIPHFQAEVWGPERIRKEGLAGLAAVARGTREEPRFITLRYAAPDARRRVALVGKAITFDSGGLSLKPPKSMETMKYDMAGGAAVIGAVAAAARLGLPVDVTGYVPATENLPGEGAQKPGM
jgi:leucyl aminopeptidase